MRVTTALALSLILLAGALSGCLGSSDDPGADVDPNSGDAGADGNSTGNQTTDGGTGDGGNATTPPGGPGTASVTVEARDFIPTGDGGMSYDTDRIEVPLGATVNLTLTSHQMNLLDHDFVIDELGVQTDAIGPGESTSIEFTATTAGEFAFYCSIGNHRDQGMEGVFVVYDPGAGERNVTA